jgi:hypothetical protein
MNENEVRAENERLRAVVAKVRQELRDFAEEYLYDGDRDRSLPGYLQLLDLAESFAALAGATSEQDTQR